jgi:hypothetical protein
MSGPQANGGAPTGRLQARLCVLLLAALNTVIALKLFGVEYSAYNASVEGTFLAIPRILVKYPGQWQWWPFWNGGLPFEDTYLPFTHWVVAGFSLLTPFSVPRSYHIVSALIYIASAPAVFWMANELSRRWAPSLLAALMYSTVSMSALLVPAIGADSGSVLNLRRLQALIAYAETPHACALMLLPVAVVFFSRARTTGKVKWKLLSGVASAFVVLSNAFGIVMLVVALLCRLMAYPQRPWWKAPLTVAGIGIVAYCWISPWLSPSMIRAIHANAGTVGGDYRYNDRAWLVLALVMAGFLLLWLALRRFKVAGYLQFFLLLAYLPAAIVAAVYIGNTSIIPQPQRYQVEVDMVLPLALVFVGAALLERVPKARFAVVAALLAVLCFQSVHSVLYARDLIRSVDATTLSEYHIAKWIEAHRPGERAFAGGSTTFIYNAFTDNPQLTGGHDQNTVNRFVPVVGYTVYNGTNAGDRDAEYSIFWLKAFGVHVISMPGANGTDAYKNIYAHPHKFDGVLPLLWRGEDGTEIYEVPARSNSLAHVIPQSAVVTRTPKHGLDTGPAVAYVAALEDPAYPAATFRWTNLSSAEIDATLSAGQVISVQETYERGWEAWVNGRRQPVTGDGIGQIVIAPDCAGPCHVSLRYTGGWEHTATRGLCLAAMLIAVGLVWRGKQVTNVSPDQA